MIPNFKKRLFSITSQTGQLIVNSLLNNRREYADNLCHLVKILSS